MSACDYSICPNCKAKAIKEKNKIREARKTAYGNIPEEEYLALIVAADKKIELDDTLREDWEIGTYEGRFFVRYQCRCEICGFNWSFSHSEELLSPPLSTILEGE